MPRIADLTLDQVNKQFEALDTIQKQLQELQQQSSYVAQHITIADPIHAPATTNNITFTWAGGPQTLSWTQGFLKDKNWNAQTIAAPAIKSSAKGQQHLYTIPAGSLSVAPHTSYWIGWDPVHQKMLATTDAGALHGNYNVHIIAQVTTGSPSQTGVAGGGGSTGGTDLSGARYSNFSTANVIIGSTSGLLVQTGSASTSPITFPVAFSGTPKVAIANYFGSVNLVSGSTTSTGFSVNFNASTSIDWIAIGPQ